MKSFTTMLALPALFIGAFAAPAAVPVEKRQVQQVVSTVEGLFKQVTTITANLNGTVSGVQSTVGGVTNVPAGVLSTVQGEITNLVALIEKTTNITSGLPVVGTVAGDATGAVGPVAEVVAKLITEITATLGNVENVVPFELITKEVGSLTSVLSGLLGVVSKLLNVGNLVQTVTGLVGGVIPLTSVTSILSGVTSSATGVTGLTSVTNILGGVL